VGNQEWFWRRVVTFVSRGSLRGIEPCQQENPVKKTAWGELCVRHELKPPTVVSAIVPKIGPERLPMAECLCQPQRYLFSVSGGPRGGYARGDGHIVTIDTEFGFGFPVGPTGYTDIQGLGFDPLRNELFAVDAKTDQLLKLDRMTGEGQVIGRTRYTNIMALTAQYCVNPPEWAVMASCLLGPEQDPADGDLSMSLLRAEE